MTLGYLDGFRGRMAYGWSSTEGVDDPNIVEVTIDGEIAARVLANTFREDLRKAGVRQGLAGFRFEIPERFCDRRPHSIDVRPSGSASPLGHSPQTFVYGRELQEKQDWCTKNIALNNIDRQALSASLSINRKLAIFATYHRHCSHLLYHKRLIDSLLSSGFTVVVTHATDGHVQDFSAIKLENCFTIIKRNVGYDFGSYALALILLDNLMHFADELILINDSIMQVSEDLWPIIQRLRAADADVVSCTESFERKYHLQSYLLWFGAKALRSSTLTDFMVNYSFTSVKEEVVEEGEVGLSQALLASGLSIKALYNYHTLATQWLADYSNNVLFIKGLPGRASTGPLASFKDTTLQTLDCIVQNILSGLPTNPTHFFWDILLDFHDFPFIKRELITTNPCSVPTYAKIAEYLAQNGEILEEVHEMIRIFGGRLIPTLIPTLPDHSEILQTLLNTGILENDREICKPDSLNATDLTWQSPALNDRSLTRRKR